MGVLARLAPLVADHATERTADALSYLLSSQVMSPGHFWRDKWTALSGPLSNTLNAQPVGDHTAALSPTTNPGPGPLRPTRAEDAQGTPTQSNISPSILVYEDNIIAPSIPQEYDFGVS